MWPGRALAAPGAGAVPGRRRAAGEGGAAGVVSNKAGHSERRLRCPAWPLVEAGELLTPARPATSLPRTPAICYYFPENFPMPQRLPCRRVTALLIGILVSTGLDRLRDAARLSMNQAGRCLRGLAVPVETVEDRDEVHADQRCQHAADHHHRQRTLR